MAQQSIIDAIKDTLIIFDGAMGTELYRRGIFTNRCYEELNLTDKKLVDQIEGEYLDAGAEVLTTNTYGANPLALEKFGLRDKTAAINKAGVEIARQAIANRGSQAWVAGDVGPLASYTDNPVELILEQVRALIDAQCDFIFFETLPNIAAIEVVALAMQKLAQEGTPFPYAVSCALVKNCETISGESVESVVACLDDENKYPHQPFAWGLNCGQGPDGMLESVERVINVVKKPLIVQPNAGIPKNVDNRYINMSTPEYFTTYAQRYVNLGASAIGGCCGIGPAHIKDAAASIKPLAKAQKNKHIFTSSTAAQPQEEVPLINRSRFAHKLATGQWVTSVELVPPRGYDLSGTIQKCRTLYQAGVDCVNIPDGPRASSKISPLITADRIQKEARMEAILHCCCRDKNLIGLQADLLACAACNITNLLFITGDPPKLGEYPDATGVFDTDSIGAVGIQKRLNQGIDLGGQAITPPTRAAIGVGLDPTALDKKREVERLFRKAEAGADFVFTQPVFDPEALLSMLEQVKSAGLPVVAGIWPLASYRNASFLQNEVPGVEIPESIMKRMEAQETREGQLVEGVAIAKEAVETIRPYVQGIQVNAPFGKIEIALQVFEK